MFTHTLRVLRPLIYEVRAPCGWWWIPAACQGLARQEAIDYMMANTGLTKQNGFEVDRYMTIRARPRPTSSANSRSESPQRGQALGENSSP